MDKRLSANFTPVHTINTPTNPKDERSCATTTRPVVFDRQQASNGSRVDLERIGY